MPRVTRNQQFQDSFRDFMVSYRDLYYEDLDGDEWSLKSNTKNKKQSMHQYAFKIPKLTFEYTIDAWTDREGVNHPSILTTGELDLPSPQEFTSVFNSYFEGFILKQYNSLLSYTSLANVHNNERGDLEATIVVCYYKSYLPYPSKNKTFEQLKEQCDHLEKENKELNETTRDLETLHLKQVKDIKRLKKQMNKMCVQADIEMREIIHRMQGKVRELYEKVLTTTLQSCTKLPIWFQQIDIVRSHMILGHSSSKEDCPVCYECIESNELIVPKCCHYICGKCYDRCDNCPICRVEY